MIDNVPYFEGVLVINRDEVLSEWKHDYHVPLVSQVVAGLSPSPEGLDGTPVSCKHLQPLHGQALQGVGLDGACKE